MPSPFVVVLSAEHEAVLTARVCSWRTEFRDRLRAQIVLEAADGASNEAIAEAARLAAEAAQPHSDLRGTEEYKRNVVRVFTERGLRAAAEGGST